MMYVVAYFGTVLQCRVLFLTIGVVGHIRFSKFYENNKGKKFYTF